MNIKLSLGAEIDLKDKIFCHCENKFDEEKIKFLIKKKFNKFLLKLPTNEFLFLKKNEGKFISYYFKKEKNICLLDLDEFSPKKINKKIFYSLDKISKFFNFSINKEINIFREINLTGNFISGFKRISLISLNGIFEKMKIKKIFLEETGCEKIRERKFLLDPQGKGKINLIFEELIFSEIILNKIFEKIKKLKKNFKEKIKFNIKLEQNNQKIILKNFKEEEIDFLKKLKLKLEINEKIMIKIKKKKKKNFSKMIFNYLNDVEWNFLKNYFKEKFNLLNIKNEIFFKDKEKKIFFIIENEKNLKKKKRFNLFLKFYYNNGIMDIFEKKKFKKLIYEEPNLYLETIINIDN